jgi:hypothetical protein
VVKKQAGAETLVFSKWDTATDPKAMATPKPGGEKRTGTEIAFWRQ